MSKNQYKNLAFKGGGVKGVAYSGAILVMEQNDLIQHVEKVAGTSAGAITASLISMRYKAEKIREKLFEMDFEKFKDKFDRKNLREYGLHSGDVFYKWMGELIEGANDPENVFSKPEMKLTRDSTFEDFRKAGCLDLAVFGTNLNRQNMKEFSYRESKDVKVLDAVRVSMSIPFFFEAYKVPGDEDIYVDGGIVYNYPLTYYDDRVSMKVKQRFNQETLGFYLENITGKHVRSDLDYASKFNIYRPFNSLYKYGQDIWRYSYNLVEAVLNAQGENLKMEPEDANRTVFIDDFGISPINFSLSDHCKSALVNSGIKFTEEYLINKGFKIKETKKMKVPEKFDVHNNCLPEFAKK